MLLFPAPDISIPIDAGPVIINNFQIYLNQINIAFQTAFSALEGETGCTPTQVPCPETKLFAVVCQGAYLDPSFTLGMNKVLWDMFLFPVVYDTVTSMFDIIVQNDLYNATFSS